MKMMTMTV